MSVAPNIKLAVLCPSRAAQPSTQQPQPRDVTQANDPIYLQMCMRHEVNWSELCDGVAGYRLPQPRVTTSSQWDKPIGNPGVFRIRRRESELGHRSWPNGRSLMAATNAMTYNPNSRRRLVATRITRKRRSAKQWRTWIQGSNWSSLPQNADHGRQHEQSPILNEGRQNTYSKWGQTDDGRRPSQENRVICGIIWQLGDRWLSTETDAFRFLSYRKIVPEGWCNVMWKKFVKRY